MSELTDNPELMLELLAKMVHRAGGYVRLTSDDAPTAAFDLKSRLDPAAGVVELRVVVPSAKR